MCSCFCTNTVDSLPQYTVTTTMTNDVLISNLRTEHNTNELTEITTVSEFDTTDKAEPSMTTENNIILGSSVPTKMFKGDDYSLIKNLSNEHFITTIESVPNDSVTTTELPIKIFDEYTTNNIYSDGQGVNEIGSTHSGIDLDKITKVTNSTRSEISDDSTDINENNKKSTNKLVTSTDESQLISTVHSLTNENDDFAENSTQYVETKTIEVTTLDDRHSETITYDSNTESTSKTIATDSQTSMDEITQDIKYLNTVNSTQLQDSFTTSTLNPADGTTKYSNDYVSSNTIKADDNSDRSTITEIFPEHVKNIQTSMFPENVLQTTTDNTFNKFSPPITTDDFQISTTNGLMDYLDVITQSTIGTHDLNQMETTTLKVLKNPTTFNNNIEITSTIYDSDNNIQTSTDKNILFNQGESTEAMNTKTFNETISFDTTTAILETTSKNVKSSSDQSMNGNPEVTTDSLNEPMDSRTIYYEEENEINNIAQVTTKSYSEINTNYNQNNEEKYLTEHSSSKIFENTTIPTVLNDNTKDNNISSVLTTTTAFDEFLIPTTTTRNQEETTLVIPNNYADPTRDFGFNEEKETTTKLDFLTTTSINLVDNSDQNSENDKTFTTKNSFINDDVFIERTTALFDKEKEIHYSTTDSVSSVTPVEDVQTGTHGVFDDRSSTFISKTISDVGVTTNNYEETKLTTLDTFILNENTEHGTQNAIETTLQPLTNKGAEFTTLNDKFDGNVTPTGVVSTESTEEKKSGIVSTDNIDVMTMTAPNQIINDFVNRLLNATKTDETATIVRESATQNIESSIVPEPVSIDDSNISQDVKKKWEALFGTSSANNLSSVNESPTSAVVGIRFTTINGTQETIPNTAEPTEAIVSKEIFTENYEVTDGSMNNAGNGIEYDLTTTVRTRGKNESVITSTSIADRDDTISASEMSTMANEVTAGSDFERINESIVSTRAQGDRTDKTEAGNDDQTTEPFAVFNPVSSFDTTTINVPAMVTDSETSGIFTTTDTDVEYVNRDNLETTTVTIITMADWIKTKSTTLKSSNEIVTDKNVENGLHSPTETNTRKNVDSVTTVIPLEPIPKTNDIDLIETTSITSLADASTMINLITTSIEVLVSNLSSENDSTTAENTITTDQGTTMFTDNYSSTTVTSSNKNDSDTPLTRNEMPNVTTTENKINSNEFIATTEQFTVSPTEETAYNILTEFPNTVDIFKNDLTPRDHVQDTTDLNDILTTTEYTITSKSIEIEDTTLKYADQNQTNINNSYSVQKITTATRKWCWNDTDCDADHKCLAAKCLPTGESRVNNCPPGIITLQCLKGIIYT